ncbi:MAG: DUF4156 domain-containing protein [Bdellovibrionales bacterium]
MSRALGLLSVIGLMGAGFLGGCSSKPKLSVIPQADEVKVSRDRPGEECKEIGVITGRTSSATGTREQALEDLKQEAANRGANYIVIKSYSGYGTGAVGTAFECP